MTKESLLIELLVEELPPKALARLGEAFAMEIGAQLQAQGLLEKNSAVQAFATPRRLAVLVQDVLEQAPTQSLSHRLMPVHVGLDAVGQPTPALLKKLRSLGVAQAHLAKTAGALEKRGDGKNTMLFLHTEVKGTSVAQGTQEALTQTIAKLPIPKVMAYQLDQGCALPGWDTVQFVRPAHGLVALYGDTVLPLNALGLQAGRCTQGHRFEAKQKHISLAHASDYKHTLEHEGAVLASFSERRERIQVQLQQHAAALDLQLVADEALLDEVTALVERPNVLVCQFDPVFLQVPRECLILTMKANQKYFPLLAADGKLSHYFLLVSNITPDDPVQVITGNERVVRSRLADARFFYEQDLKKTLQARAPDLHKVVYHNQLGSQAQRSQRVAAIAAVILDLLHQGAHDKADEHNQAGAPSEAISLAVAQAAHLAKCDLLSDMVGEFPELQGIMGGYYARHEGLQADVAIAIEDHYKPRFAGDALPRNHTGTVLALADKLETLVGMFGIGSLPSGDKDPYALRRHALGILRMILEQDLPLNLSALLQRTAAAFGDRISNTQATIAAVSAFMLERLGGLLRDQGYDGNAVDAVLALHPDYLNTTIRRLQALHSFAAMPQAAALVAANKRITNILKKSEAPDTDKNTTQTVQAALLRQHAEKDLYATLQKVLPQVKATMDRQEYTQALQALAALKTPVDAFFEHVMVNDPDLALRANRLALLQAVHKSMNQVADIARLVIA